MSSGFGVGRFPEELETLARQVFHSLPVPDGQEEPMTPEQARVFARAMREYTRRVEEYVLARYAPQGGGRRPSTHHPLPWRRVERPSSWAQRLYGADGRLVLEVPVPEFGDPRTAVDEGAETADYVARACLAHDPLYEALSKMYASSQKMEGVAGSYWEKALREARAAMAVARPPEEDPDGP